MSEEQLRRRIRSMVDTMRDYPEGDPQREKLLQLLLETQDQLMFLAIDKMRGDVAHTHPEP